VHNIVSTVIIIIGIVILAILLLKLFKSILKALIILVLIVLSGVLILGLITYSDLRSAEQALEGDKLLVYQHGATHLPIHIDKDTKLTLKAEELAKGIRTTKTGNETITITTSDNWLNKTFRFNHRDINPEQFTQIMNSEKPQEKFGELTTGNSIDLVSQDYKALLYLHAFTNTLKAGPEHIITGIKNKEVNITPEFISINILRKIPDQAFAIAVQQALTFTEEES